MRPCPTENPPENQKPQWNYFASTDSALLPTLQKDVFKSMVWMFSDCKSNAMIQQSHNQFCKFNTIGENSKIRGSSETGGRNLVPMGSSQNQRWANFLPSSGQCCALVTSPMWYNYYICNVTYKGNIITWTVYKLHAK